MIPSPNPDVLTKYTWSTQGLQFYIHLKPSKEVMLRRHIWAIIPEIILPMLEALNDEIAQGGLWED